MRRSLMGLANCSLLLVAAVALPARHVGAQLPIPKQYRAEAASLNGGQLDDDPSSNADGRAQRRAADSIAATTPQVTPVMERTAEIASGGFQLEAFVVPPSSHCTLTGSSDSDKSFEVLVMPNSDMAAWRSGDRANPVWQSGRAKSITVDISLTNAGIYDLVISNRAAWFLTRKITTKVELTCTGDWPPSEE
jgi:hypothetical protein